MVLLLFFCLNCSPNFRTEAVLQPMENSSSDGNIQLESWEFWEGNDRLLHLLDLPFLSEGVPKEGRILRFPNDLFLGSSS